MSNETTVRTSTRARFIKKLLRPLSVSGIPAVQDLARNMNDLVEVIQPRFVQATAVNDATGRKIIGHIEAITQVVVPTIMNMDGDEDGDGSLSKAETTYVEHLCSFSDFLKETRAEVEEQLGRSGTSRILHHTSMHELLVECERELQTRMLHLVLATCILTNESAANMRRYLVAGDAKLDRVLTETAQRSSTMATRLDDGSFI
ncbi:hypothetical protein BDV93DRAFT_549438, partial [Ceratobasidium sp. AG-I]